MSRAAELRLSADECLRLAVSATNPLDKERWLMLAEYWFALAKREDERGTLN